MHIQIETILKALRFRIRTSVSKFAFISILLSVLLFHADIGSASGVITEGCWMMIIKIGTEAPAVFKDIAQILEDGSIKQKNGNLIKDKQGNIIYIDPNDPRKIVVQQMQPMTPGEVFFHISNPEGLAQHFIEKFIETAGQIYGDFMDDVQLNGYAPPHLKRRGVEVAGVDGWKTFHYNGNSNTGVPLDLYIDVFRGIDTDTIHNERMIIIDKRYFMSTLANQGIGWIDIDVCLWKDQITGDETRLVVADLYQKGLAFLDQTRRHNPFDRG